MSMKDLKNILPGSTPDNKNRPPAELKQESALQPPSVPDGALIIVPMRGTVLFPQNVSPLVIGRKSSIAAIQQAVRTEKPVGFLLQLREKDQEPGPTDLYAVGTVADILRYLTASDGSHHIVCQGLQRFRVQEFLPGYPFLVARCELYEKLEGNS